MVYRKRWYINKSFDVKTTEFKVYAQNSSVAFTTLTSDYEGNYLAFND